MVEIPPYFLLRPPMPTDPEVIHSFERLLESAVERGWETPIEYTLSAPKWQFLCWIAENRDIVLHGSGNSDIDHFEPRKANDINEFGDRNAIYAASDGIWPMYFAILDRERYPMTLSNGCFHRVSFSGGDEETFYFFSITEDARKNRPYRSGTVYLLPRKSFEPQPSILFKGMEIRVAQWASPTPVTPLAKMIVHPEDFPFLSEMRGHNDKIMFERASADPDGFPWLDE
jgi:hypothetical protein